MVNVDALYEALVLVFSFNTLAVARDRGFHRRRRRRDAGAHRHHRRGADAAADLHHDIGAGDLVMWDNRSGSVRTENAVAESTL